MKRTLKKIGQVILCILPLLCALLIQIVVSFLAAMVYGMLQGIQLAAEGTTDANAISKAITKSLTPEILLVISAFSAGISILVFGLWYRRTIKEEKKINIKKIFSIKSILNMILLAIGLQVGISIVLNMVASIKPEWFKSYNDLIELLGMGNSVISVLLIVFIAPIAEELIFRGVILEKSKKVMPIAAANVLQAILFGIYHMNMIQGTYAFVIGMFFGMVAIKFNSLLASIILHMLINLSGILLNMILPEKALSMPEVMIGSMILSIVIIVFSSINLSKNQVPLEEKELVAPEVLT